MPLGNNKSLHLIFVALLVGRINVVSLFEPTHLKRPLDKTWHERKTHLAVPLVKIALQANMTGKY